MKKLLYFIILFTLPIQAKAQLGLEELEKQGVLGAEKSGEAVIQFVSVALSMVGLLLVALIIYGGYIWMTSQGDAEKLKKAKGTITSGIIGFALIMASYAIMSLIVNTLL